MRKLYVVGKRGLVPTPVQLAHYASGDAEDEGVGWHVARDERTRPHDGTSADRDPRQHRGTSTDPGAHADAHRKHRPQSSPVLGETHLVRLSQEAHERADRAATPDGDVAIDEHALVQETLSAIALGPQTTHPPRQLCRRSCQVNRNNLVCELIHMACLRCCNLRASWSPYRPRERLQQPDYGCVLHRRSMPFSRHL